MTIYFLHGKPHIAVSNGFQPISEYTYYMMLEHGEIKKTEVIEHD